jgi:hypothetical protein
MRIRPSGGVEKIRKLALADPIKAFHSGFGMWHANACAMYIQLQSQSNERMASQQVVNNIQSQGYSQPL